MLELKKNKNNEQTVIFKIEGMHCTSCAMTIDGELEDTQGVVSAETSYAQAKTVVTFDASRVTKLQLKQIIESQNYSVNEVA